jgi:hypothetical protein
MSRSIANICDAVTVGEVQGVIGVIGRSELGGEMVQGVIAMRVKKNEYRM